MEGVDFQLRRGGCHALIGPNGAGKTTFFNLLTRFVDPSSGSIWYDGEDITRVSAHSVARMGMVRSFQISATFAQLTAIENVYVALQQTRGMSMAFWRGSRGFQSMTKEALAFLDRAGLSRFANTKAGEMPYGRRRALELVTTLALGPSILLLDEPMSGLGSEDIEAIQELIRQFSVERTVLMVEHNISVVASLAQRVSVMVRGTIIAEGTYQEVSGLPEVIEAYLGADHA